MNEVKHNESTCYTFSVKGIDNLIYYPAKAGDQMTPIEEWTTDINKAIRWDKKEYLDCLAVEFCNSQIIEINEQYNNKE
jgi:hypothetical protein